MIKTQYLDTTDDVAKAAADHAVATLGRAISVRGTAVWVVAAAWSALVLVAYQQALAGRPLFG